MKLIIVLLALITVSANAATIATITSFVNHTAKEKTRNGLALEKIREVAQGECFKNAWLKRKLIQTNGKTNLEVLEHLLSSNAKIELEMYKSIKRVNGYTYPSSKRIWLNRKYHNYFGVCSASNNIFHEVSHKIGYAHDYKANSKRPYSVPYSINAVMDICCKD